MASDREALIGLLRGQVESARASHDLVERAQAEMEQILTEHEEKVRIGAAAEQLLHEMGEDPEPNGQVINLPRTGERIPLISGEWPVIRQWAQDRHMKIATRGRIPAHIVRAYEADQAAQAQPQAQRAPARRRRAAT